MMKNFDELMIDFLGLGYNHLSDSDLRKSIAMELEKIDKVNTTQLVLEMIQAYWKDEIKHFIDNSPKDEFSNKTMNEILDIISKDIG